MLERAERMRCSHGSEAEKASPQRHEGTKKHEENLFTQSEWRVLGELENDSTDSMLHQGNIEVE